MGLAEIIFNLKRNLDENKIMRLSIRRDYILDDAILEAQKSKFNSTRLIKVNEVHNIISNII